MKFSPLNGIIAAAAAIVFTSAILFILAPQNETANWRVYTNNVLGFSIKYPSGEIQERATAAYLTVGELSIQIINAAPSLLQTFDQFRNAKKDTIVSDSITQGRLTKLYNLNVDGFPAVELLNKLPSPGALLPGTPPRTTMVVYVKKDAIIWEIIGTYVSSGSLFHQILSTFKFIQ